MESGLAHCWLCRYLLSSYLQDITINWNQSKGTSNGDKQEVYNDDVRRPTSTYVHKNSSHHIKLFA